MPLLRCAWIRSIYIPSCFSVCHSHFSISSALNPLFSSTLQLHPIGRCSYSWKIHGLYVLRYYSPILFPLFEPASEFPSSALHPLQILQRRMIFICFRIPADPNMRGKPHELIQQVDVPSCCFVPEPGPDI